MATNYMQDMFKSSHISGGSAEYVDNLYEAFLADPNQVEPEWREYFEQIAPQTQSSDVSHAEIRESFRELAKRSNQAPAVASGDAVQQKKQAHVLQLINAYREHGHHHAKLDPLGMTERMHIPDLELSTHQLSEADFDSTFSTESPISNNGTKLKEIYSALKKTYCDTLGIEYMHISDSRITKWFQQRMESSRSHPALGKEEKTVILQQLTAAEGLEKYLGSRYVGQKRFSLEGGDSLIPMLDAIIEKAGSDQVKELIIGMAHRGRLNVLVNILGKSPEMLYEEFEGRTQGEFSGDVKYHMGFSSDLKTKNGNLHLALAFNPSHLEIIGPVAEGSARARLRRRSDLDDKKSVLPVIIHGDAAFAGQGVVMETFNFSQARGYSTGGTLHIVINNQIGFTTSNPLDSRSTLYCTDVAKMVQAPVIHVNGNDPEAVVYAAKLAFDFRQEFGRDVVLDLVCYRRHGHNEADEPAVTQPKMYEAVRAMPTTRELYAKKLIEADVLSQNDADAMVESYRDLLDSGRSVVKNLNPEHVDNYAVDWSPYVGTDWRDDVDTSITKKELKKLAGIIEELPEHITPHPVVKRLLADRVKMTNGEVDMNWGYAENMAYASLVAAGYPVRLSGQDSGRGTFAHRHAVIHDFKTGEAYIPLQEISDKRDQVIIIDSVLSEEAVLGFEYGYAAAEPNVLVIWEAQFGDFANGAQVVIDQFISSGEQKWGRLSGLVMLLPHGYEGQGPEHSSARLERYLQLCAQQNMQVCVPTTPAQIFHLLRRQMLRPYRKPLIVMTPKSLLRHKLAVSPLSDLTEGQYHLVIPEIDDIDAKKVKRVVMCSGKVYYDLLERRRKDEIDNVAIIRIEQLYPFPKKELKAQLELYRSAKDVVWCQEEPQNQGAWYPSRHNMEFCLTKGQSLRYVGRGFFAAPAEGSAGLHAKQQKALVEEALN